MFKLLNQIIHMLKNSIFFFIVLLIFQNLFAVENDIVSTELIANNCNSCHGWSGEGYGKNNKLSLKNDNYDYFIKKMLEFKKNEQDSVMSRLTFFLSEADIERLANYYYPK